MQKSDKREMSKMGDSYVIPSADLLALQSSLPTTPVAAKIEGPDEAGEIVVRPEAAGTPAQSGVAFLGAFFGGHRHVLRTSVRLESAARLRIEVHGHVSRMNKLVVQISRDGSVLSQGEEIESVVVSPNGAMLDIEMKFRARSSMVEWIYFMGQAIADGQEIVLRCSGTSLQPLPEADASLYRRHLPVQNVNGVAVVCQRFTALNGGFNLMVEIQKPGSTLVGLGLSSQLDLAHVRWWTGELAGLNPRPGELWPCRAAHAIRSPALMDVFGPSFANYGHAISGVFSDWHELDRMDAETADRHAEMTLHARFDDGDIVDLRLAEIFDMPRAVSKGNILFERYRTAYLANISDTPTFLEVGARGESSALIRRMVEKEWHYTGLDYAPGSNVDIVGDAHLLTDFVARESIDLVYSSEVMEHLLSPLRFVLEANRVLKLYGLFIARMPTTWPLHAEPWDFWRISVHGWTSILNANTGFEILERCEVGSASVVPHLAQQNSGLMSMAGAPAPMLTMVIARKIRDVPVDTTGWSADLATGNYDHA